MNIPRIIPALLLIVCVTACASTPGGKGSAFTPLNMDQIPSKETLLNPSADKLPPDDQDKIAKDVEALITYCQPILGGLERRSHKWARIAFWASMAGVLAGAVVAPALIAANAAANKAWIAGFSGFAGATNTASIAMETSGLSGTASAKERNDIIERIRTDMKVIVDPKATVSDIRMNLIAARAECALYEISVPTIPAGKKTN